MLRRIARTNRPAVRSKGRHLALDGILPLKLAELPFAVHLVEERLFVEERAPPISLLAPGDFQRVLSTCGKIDQESGLAAAFWMQRKAALLAIQMRKGSLPAAAPQPVVKHSERAEDLLHQQLLDSMELEDAKIKNRSPRLIAARPGPPRRLGYDANEVRENLDWRDL